MPRQPARASSGRYVSRLTGGTLAIIMAGGRGERLQRPHRAPLQARHALRRQVPHRRFRALELRQLRHPPDLDPDAVQGAVADPARAARLELPARRVRRVRRGDSGAAADRAALVPRHRGCGAPEPRADPVAPPQARAGAGRRSHLQDGLRSDDRLPRGEGRRHHRGRGRGAGARVAPLRRADRHRVEPGHPLRREAAAAGHAPRPARQRSSPRWASTSSTPGCCEKLLAADAANETSAHDFGKNILPEGHQRQPARCLPTRSRT